MPQDQNRSLGRFHNKISNIPRGHNFLFIIGIDEYQHGIPLLSNAVRDAQAFRYLLWKQYQFEPSHTVSLFNEEATRGIIIKKFYEFLDKLTDQDNLVFYFSGHGELHPTTQRGFWIPVNAHRSDASTYLNNLEVIDFLRNLKARHVFGIVDSCFSAALFTQRSLDQATHQQYSIPSRWLLTAGRLEPVYDGGFGKHSSFAESLLSQLKYPSEDALWVSELCRKVLRGVPFNEEQQMHRGEPLQNGGHQGGEFVFFKKSPFDK